MTIILSLFVEVLVLGINHIKLNIHSLDNKSKINVEVAMLIIIHQNLIILIVLQLLQWTLY